MGKRALFLDRDGVVINDSGYAKDARFVQLIPGIVDLIGRARKRGDLVVVVTNQSGLGRRWVTLEQYLEVNARMEELLGGFGVFLDAVYFAPFHKGAEPLPEMDGKIWTSGLQRGLWSDDWRKPKAGMLLEASRELGIDLSASVLVGDRCTDHVAAVRAGLMKSYWLMSTGHAHDSQERLEWEVREPRLIRFYDWVNKLEEIAL